MKIPLEPVSAGFAGIEQELPRTGPAGLGLTGICNHMQLYAQICQKNAEISSNMHKICIENLILDAIHM